MSDGVVMRTVNGRTLELRRNLRGWYWSADQFDIDEIVDGVRHPITKDIDPPMFEGDLKKYPTAILRSLLTPRKRALIDLMAQYDIVAGDDYQHEDDYELLYSAKRPGRWVAVSADSSYSHLHVCGSLRKALESCASEAQNIYDEYACKPVGVYDLDDRRLHDVQIRATAKLLP